MLSTSSWVVIGLCVLLAYVWMWVYSRKSEKNTIIKTAQALLLCLFIAVVATLLSKVQHYIGAPMIGLLVGMLVVNLCPNIGGDFKKGTAFVGKRYLSLGIILAGGTLNFVDVMEATKALPLIIFNLCLSFLVAYLVGTKVLKLSNNTAYLVGGGTAICGGTAIATLSSIIKAKEEEIAYAMTAIFLFDVLAALSYPYLAIALNLTPGQFGYLAGTAINDTSSVAAAQETYVALTQMTDYSQPVTVKLVRTTMLIVVAIIFTIVTIRKESKASQGTGGKQESVGAVVLRVFPWFIVAFIAMSILNTVGAWDIIPGASTFCKEGYKFFVAVALAGVGFKIRFYDLFTKGAKPILLGGVTWLCVAASTFTFINVFAGYIG